MTIMVAWDHTVSVTRTIERGLLAYIYITCYLLILGTTEDMAYIGHRSH